MKSEMCLKCGDLLCPNPAVELGTPATDYGKCHAFCDRCRIGISNSRDPERRTYICKELADNLAAPESEQRYLKIMQHALNQRNRGNKIRRARFEKSEDTLTWSVFSHLEERGVLSLAAQALTGAVWSEPAHVLYWGYNDQGPGWLRDKLVGVLQGLGESARSFSEPDLILHAPQTGLLFVEIKYASPNSRRYDRNKAARYIQSSSTYLEPNSERMRHYELLRNWVIGCLLAAQLNLPFWLVNLVRRSKELDIEHSFGQFLCQDDRHQFRRAQWEGLFKTLGSALDQPADNRLWSYIKERTIHFQPAFELGETG